MRSSLILRAGTVLLAAAMASTAMATSQYDMTPGVTEISQKVFELHRFMLYICIAIGVGVFGVMFYSIFAHRKSKGVKPADFHESTLVEVIWTVIPFVILIVMAVPATRVLIEMNDSGEADLTVRVTGSQWKWHYEYLSYGEEKDIGLGFLSVLSTPRDEFDRRGKGISNMPDFEKHPNYLVEVDKPLVIPTGKKVRFLVTADDVIHAWWVPDFAVKKDAIPGFINEIWTNVPEGKEGVYRGRCAELCGKDHAYMPIVVEAVSQADFDKWLVSAKARAEEEAKAAAMSADYKFADVAEASKLGEEQYNAKCAACHQVAGTGLPPMFPALKGSKMVANKGDTAAQINILLNGKGAMPAWKGVMTPKEIAAVITYTRNAWGNDTGDLVQPSDVAQ